MDNRPLTPTEFAKLSELLFVLEEIIKDPYLVEHTNVLSVYEMLYERVIYETDPILESNLYSNPFINKPI